MPFALSGDLEVVTLRTVVVDNDFLRLPVAFAWSKDDSTSFLQHGNEVGDNDSLRKEILCGAKEFGTLPAPASFLLIVEASVTGP